MRYFVFLLTLSYKHIKAQFWWYSEHMLRILPSLSMKFLKFFFSFFACLTMNLTSCRYIVILEVDIRIYMLQLKRQKVSKYALQHI